jgi:hypothetical protein
MFRSRSNLYSCPLAPASRQISNNGYDLFRSAGDRGLANAGRFAQDGHVRCYGAVARRSLTGQACAHVHGLRDRCRRDPHRLRSGWRDVGRRRAASAVSGPRRLATAASPPLKAIPHMPDQIIDAVMARSVHADAVRAHPLAAW